MHAPRAVLSCVLLGLLVSEPAAGQSSASSPGADAILLPAGLPTGLPRVLANDNTVPAGLLENGILELDLEVMWADWRPETPDRPGLRVAAVAEAGGPPSIPAPLIRVTEGTRLRVSFRNGVDDEVTVFGLHPRGGEGEPLVVAPGRTGTVEFEAGEPGTYLYRVRVGPEPTESEDADEGEREQLAGAFVVDPVGGAPADRILVLNIFSQELDTVAYAEALTINGRSWPFTERMELSVGEPVRWRVVNASGRSHPMHLHGFYFEVLARGTETADTLYAPRDRRLAVTEPMLANTTMLMEWTPTRPGSWLFHCHLSFHVSAEVRLPGAADLDAPGDHVHMAGLVVGIEVAPGPSDLVHRGEPKRVELYANEYGDRQGYRFGFAADPDAAPDDDLEVPGPVLVFQQHDVAEVTVVNRTSVPTSVHWHGLELDAWADGVPSWSRSDGRVSPVIRPGSDFTYRLSFMRPGTFIYHSHLDDVHQLTGGLYGALIVLPRGEELDPRTDHVRVWGWAVPDPESIEDVELNGRREQPHGRAQVGETHRFRLINIAPAGMLTAWLTRDGETVPLVLHAKDGADLPEHQRVPVEGLPRFGAGETVDFTWTPDEPGTYELRIGYNPEASLVQTWEVTAPGG